MVDMTNEQTEQTTDEPRYVSIPGVLAMTGVIMWIASLATYLQEHADADNWRAAPANYAPSLLLLAGGCFLVLLAAVMSSRHHNNG